MRWQAFIPKAKPENPKGESVEAQTYYNTEAQGVVGDGMPRRVMRLSRNVRGSFGHLVIAFDLNELLGLRILHESLQLCEAHNA